MASLQLKQSAVASLAERIVQARKLYGADSAYVIGLFAGLEWLLDSGELDAVRRQILDRVIELEGGKASALVTPSQTRPAPDSSARGRGEGLAENTWIRGSVKWFNNDKGYGFISTAADTDVFVHWRDISSWDRSLTQGDEVEFMVTKTAKGFQAINVMKPGAGGAGASHTAVQGDEADRGDGDGHDQDGPRGDAQGDTAAAESPPIHFEASQTDASEKGGAAVGGARDGEAEDALTA